MGAKRLGSNLVTNLTNGTFEDIASNWGIELTRAFGGVTVTRSRTSHSEAPGPGGTGVGKVEIAVTSQATLVNLMPSYDEDTGGAISVTEGREYIFTCYVFKQAGGVDLGHDDIMIRPVVTGIPDTVYRVISLAEIRLGDLIPGNWFELTLHLKMLADATVGFVVRADKPYTSADFNDGGGPLYFDQMRVYEAAYVNIYPDNEMNFLRWKEARFLITDDCEGDDGEPWVSDRDLGRSLRYNSFLPCIANEEYFYFVNMADTDLSANQSNYRLGLWDKGTVYDLAAINFSGATTDWKMYGDFKLLSSFKDGVYNLVIYRDDDNYVRWVSNAIKIINGHEWKRKTLYVEFANSKDILNYNYEALGVTTLNGFRIFATLENEQGESEANEYRGVDGKRYNSKKYLDKSHNLRIKACDQRTHDAVDGMLLHDTIQISVYDLNRDHVTTKTYIPSGGYTRETGRSNLSLTGGEVKMYEQEFTKKIKYF